MGTRAFILYLISGFFLAILSVFFLPDFKSKNDVFSYQNLQSPAEGLENGLRGSVKVWPDLEFNWKSVVATIVGFLGSAFGTVGGVGGGGIFVPMLTLIVGFDAKSAAALSKCMIMGASASSVWYNLRLPHPTKDVPIIDYDLALLFQPMLMLGITIGVELSVIFPYWLITVLIIVLFIGTSSRSFMKGIEMWKEETIIKKEMAKLETRSNSNEQVVIDADYHTLLPEEEKSGLQMLLFNIKWKGILMLLVVWSVFLALQILKNDAVLCSPWYWVITVLQFPVAFSVFLYEAVKLYRECKKRKMSGNPEAVCGASIEWNVAHLAFSALCGILGGTVGGLLGSGGGFILGPLLLEFGVIPQVASATATFVMMFSSSLSVVEFYLLKRFPMSYALYLIAVSVLAGFWGQSFIRKLVTLLKRASLIVFVLSAVIFASALTMGVIGVETSVRMMKQHQYMGFLQFCER